VATMIVGSQQFFVDPDQVEPIKEQVSQLVPGASINYGYTDSDGDSRWVFIPYGCPISITTWANEQ
jgi:hypothetical protein